MKNHLLTITVCLIVIFIIINNYIFFPGNILSWDVFGYYLYLPLKFIYHNLGIGDSPIITQIIDKYHNTATFYQGLKMPNGNYVMKYSMGISFFYTPFFFIGHLIALYSTYPADGFSYPYQYSIFIGGLIYSLIGIWALTKVLMRFFESKIVAIVIFLIVFATNYIIHITMYGQNAMSHNFLFATYAIILWLTILWYESNKLKYAIWLAIVCGISILSRPSEIVCLIIPALWGLKDFTSIPERVKLLLKYKLHIILFAFIIIIIGSFQLIYWKIFAGKFLFNSYGANAGEGFEFTTPYIWQVLFSFRKGWFVYTPIMLFAVTGFYFIFKENRSVFYALSLYFIANIYFVSSWSCWWYAQSFGQRALIPSYPVMAIGLGYFLKWLFQQKFYLKMSVYVLIVSFLALNIFQTIQFHYGILDGDRMTAKYYFKIFGKMQVTEEDKKLLLIKRSFDGTEIFQDEHNYNCSFKKVIDFNDSGQKDSTFVITGQYSFKLDSSTIYSPCIEISYSQLTTKDHAWIRITGEVFPTQDVLSNPFSLVVHFNHKDYPYKYTAFDSEKMNLEVNKWNKISFDYLTPEVRWKRDNLKVYFWQRGKFPLYVDNLAISVYENRND